MDLRTYLKIKIKTLAAEAGIIRREESKVKAMEKWSMQHHRKTVVRDAARRSLVAYQIIRGRCWQQTVSKLRHTRYNDWEYVRKMLMKYGDTPHRENMMAPHLFTIEMEALYEFWLEDPERSDAIALAA